MTTNSKDNKVVFLTPTLQRDIERFALLSDSLRKFYKGPLKHYVVAPSKDLHAFKERMHDQHIVFIAEEDVVPSYWYPFFKNMFGIKRHRGWLIQQIIKLNSPQFIEEENIVIIDSDIVLIRPFDENIFFENTVLKFFKTPKLIHATWIDASARILKLSSLKEPEIDYIGNLISWNRSNLIKMQQHIESSHNRPWPKVFLKETFFSEYNTYGLYYENILNDNSHTIYTEPLTYNAWTQNEYENLFMQDTAIPPQFIGILVQSNIGIDPSQYYDKLKKYIEQR